MSYNHRHLKVNEFYTELLQPAIVLGSGHTETRKIDVLSDLREFTSL